MYREGSYFLPLVKRPWKCHVTVAVPAAWAEYNGEAIDFGVGPSAGIVASTKLDDFFSFTAPGAYIIGNTGKIGYIQSLDLWKDLFTADLNNCQYVSREDYSDTKFTGKIDILVNCANSGNSFFVVSASPSGNAADYTVTVIVNSPTDEDKDTAVATLTTILDSFDVTGDLPQ